MTGRIQRRSASESNQLYGDQASSDCIIQIGDVTIPAHRRILMAHSPAFQVIFSNPSAESRRGVVEISDFHPESVRAMIRYCYEDHIGTATLDSKWGKEVFQLADKYFIEPLKAHAEKHFIKRKLCLANVIEMALLADSHSAPKLMEACIKLFAREWRTIKGSVDWAELKRVRPELAIYLAEEVLVKESRLSEEHVVEMALLADSHSAPKLMKACVKLFARKWKIVIKSVDWAELKRVRPELAVYLAEEVFVKESRLSGENVVEMALLADSHSALKLRKACVEFFYMGPCWGEEWKELERVKPQLAADLRKEVQALSERRR